MDPLLLALLLAAVLVVAFLYSSVGHAGASGYIAVMSLAGLAPEEIRPTALVLNLFVATITFWQFRRAGHFRWALFWPFAVLSIPMAALGGYVHLPTAGFKIAVGVVLLFSATRLFVRPAESAGERTPGRAVSLGVGGALGLVAGLTGTGGGIFLTPILVFLRWAPVKTAGAVSALFILVNSAAGLAGNQAAAGALPDYAWMLVIAVVAGGAAGSYLGSRRFDPIVVKRLLGVVLAIAGLKLVLV